MTSKRRAISHGVTAAVLIFLVSSGTITLFFASAYAQTAPLFSVTILNPTSASPVTRQYLSILASNMIALGIDARLVDVDDNAWNSRLNFANSTQGALYSQGGYDVGPDRWDFFPPVLPDFKAVLDGRPPNLAPSGYNNALYNNTIVNNLFDQLDAPTDTQTKINLVHKLQELVFHDSPYAYIYEPVDIIPRNQKWNSWGGKNVYSNSIFPDIQHYSGGSNFTLAVAYAFNVTDTSLEKSGNLNPALTVIDLEPGRVDWDIIFATDLSGAGLMDQDSRDLSFYQALATNITHSRDGLDWSVQIRKGALWQSGVEVTSDDFVWTRWAIFNPKTASINQIFDLSNLGNVASFTFLNGTTVTVDNRVSTNQAVRYCWWKAVDKYSFQFHLYKPYAFTREYYAGFAPLPKHIMERFPPETWDAQPFSTAKSPYTYTWNTAQYGGSGSYTAVGPVGDGPYYLQNYNFTTNVATLKKFHQYWNATGLEALGQFTVETYKVVVISDKQQALEALRNGQVDQLDSEYDLSGSDLPTLQSLGVNVIHAPHVAFYQLDFNLRHPVIGTGVDTPLGKSNPLMAAEAARHVRKAISHLIPRDRIVNELLGGVGVALASWLGPGWGIWYNNDLKPDSYDNNTAAAELRAAGYTVGEISNLTSTQQDFSPWLVGGGIVALVVLSSSTLLVVKRKRRRGLSTVARKMIPTGYAELEGLLHGGIPFGYSVLLISPPCDERDLLLRKMLKSNLSSGMQVFHVSGDLGRTQDFVGMFRTDFYAFSPEAHRISSSEQNLFEIPGLGNLVEFNIVLNKGLSDHAKEGKPKVIVMDLLSDLLLRHKAIMTRRWLTEFLAKRKGQQFTTICILNPAIASKEEAGRVTDLFDGIIEIYEKESEGRLKRFLAIRKMYGQDYSESELLLERSKLL